MHDLDAVRRSKLIREPDFATLHDTEPSTDRRFLLGGEEFTFKTKVAADLMGKFYDAPEAITPTCPHCQQRFTVGSPRPQQDALAAADAMIVAFLEPGQEERWEAIRSNDAGDPLTIKEVMAVGNYLLGAMTSRPTERPSDSSDTPATPGTSSTAGSDSQGQD